MVSDESRWPCGVFNAPELEMRNMIRLLMVATVLAVTITGCGMNNNPYNGHGVHNNHRSEDGLHGLETEK